MKKSSSRGNGMTDDHRYAVQQKALNDAAHRLGVVAFRPDYHGKQRDGNTVLFYTKEDDAHNREVDKLPTHWGSADEARMYGCTDERYYYRRPFWSFENTDVNGMLSLDFANRGLFDLRGVDTPTVLESALTLAFCKKKMNAYVACIGGWLDIKEADDIVNDLNREIISNFCKAHKKCFFVTVNGGKDDPIFTEYHGEDVKNFACDYIVPKENEHLQALISGWRDGTMHDVGRISVAVEYIGGITMVWS